MLIAVNNDNFKNTYLKTDFYLLLKKIWLVKMINLSKLNILKIEQKAIHEAVNVLLNKFPIAMIFLYGSKARGDDDEYSDIDLMLIMNSTFETKVEKSIVENLFEIGLKYNVMFSSVRTSLQEWNGIFKTFPIYKEIMKDGVRII